MGIEWPRAPVHPDIRYRCMLCGRDKLLRPGQPHTCNGVFRKRFKSEAKRRGLPNAFVKTVDVA